MACSEWHPQCVCLEMGPEYDYSMGPVKDGVCLTVLSVVCLQYWPNVPVLSWEIRMQCFGQHHTAVLSVDGRGRKVKRYLSQGLCVVKNM